MLHNAALDAAKRASERSAARVHGEMKRGLTSLASIAATAPFVGIFGTLRGILNSFFGAAGDKYSDYGLRMRYLSEALVPTELALLVALLAFCSYKYFSARLEGCDVEMRSASLELLNELALIRF
ncbi:MAG TPA: MotA/TolQ/ExbB proton channel family protein [Bryobacteraceae bacterium]|jgi:biopolymer transport protein ExbB/TolQ